MVIEKMREIKVGGEIEISREKDWNGERGWQQKMLENRQKYNERLIEREMQKRITVTERNNDSKDGGGGGDEDVREKE